MIFVALAIAVFFLAIVGAFVAPGIALAATLCVYGFETLLQSKISYFATHSSVVNYASAVIVFCAVISAGLKGQISFSRFGLLECAVLAFYVLRFASYFWAADRAWWYSVMMYDAPYAVAYLAFLPLAMNRLKNHEVGIKSTIIIGACILFLLLTTTQMHKWGRRFEVEQDLIDRYGQAKEGGSPLAVTGLAGQVTLMVILVAWRRFKPFWIVARIFVILLCCAIIFQTDTRGQLIALIPAVCLTLPFRWPRLNLRLVFGVSFALLVLGLAVYLGASFSIHADRWNPDRMISDYTGTRLILASKVFDEWLRSSPWNLMLGLGSGISWSIQGIYPHIILVEILAESGVVGLSIYLFILAMALKAFANCILIAGKNDLIRSMACCLFAIMMFEFVLSFKQGGTNAIHMLLIIPMLLGRLEVALQGEKERVSSKSFPKPTVFVRSAAH